MAKKSPEDQNEIPFLEKFMCHKRMIYFASEVKK